MRIEQFEICILKLILKKYISETNKSVELKFYVTNNGLLDCANENPTQHLP